MNLFHVERESAIRMADNGWYSYDPMKAEWRPLKLHGPPPPDSIVGILMKSGNVSLSAKPVKNWRWTDTDSPTDIVAYCVVA